MNKKSFLFYVVASIYLIIGCSRQSLIEKQIDVFSKSNERDLSKITLVDGNELPCGTIHSSEIHSFENNLSALSAKSISSNPYCVQIAFYIVRNSDGSGGFNASDISGVLRGINDAYNIHNIYFFSAGISYINNTEFMNTNVGTNNEFPALIASGNNPNAISFYLVPTLMSNNDALAGVANGILSKHLIVRNEYADPSSGRQTPAHEIGHCLNLLHTHETALGIEAINGSNCTTAGDLICDTPADPGLVLGGNVSYGCQYTGGNGYNPLVNNIMSYSGTCRTSFTNGQGTRSSAALASSTVLQPIKSTSCNIPTISDPNISCNGYTYTLTNIPANTTVLWDIEPSGNVTMSNQTSNSITVNVISGSSETVRLRARITYSDGNRISLTKTTVVTANNAPSIALNPVAMQCMTMGSSRYISAGYTTNGSFQDISTHPSVAEVDWQVIDNTSNTQITSFSKHSSSVINSAITLNIPTKSNDYVLTVLPRAKDKCGTWGNWGPGHVYFIKRNCSSPSYALDVEFDISAQRYTLILSDSYNQIRSVISKNSNSLMKSTYGYDIKVMDMNGGEVFTMKSSTDKKISLPKLASGKYTIELLQDGYIYTQILETY